MTPATEAVYERIKAATAAGGGAPPRTRDILTKSDLFHLIPLKRGELVRTYVDPTDGFVRVVLL